MVEASRRGIGIGYVEDTHNSGGFGGAGVRSGHGHDEDGGGDDR